MKTKKATAGEKLAYRFAKFPGGQVVYGPVWANEMGHYIDRLIASQRQAERTRVARIVERCIVAKIKDLEEDNPPSRRVHEVQKQFDALDWTIKQAIKPAKKRATP